MDEEINWKLVESSGYGIKILRTEIPFFRNSILQNKPLESRELIQKFKNNGICDIYGNLTPRGFVVGISCLNLNEQCIILRIKINYKETEISVLEYYKKQGYEGSTFVWQIISDIIYSICFDILYPLNIKKYGDKIIVVHTFFSFMPV